MIPARGRGRATFIRIALEGGNYGHAGRPGLVGGSAPRGLSRSTLLDAAMDRSNLDDREAATVELLRRAKVRGGRKMYRNDVDHGTLCPIDLLGGAQAITKAELRHANRNCKRCRSFAAKDQLADHYAVDPLPDKLP